MGLLDRVTFKAVVPRAARRADHVLAVSERTKRDAVELYGLPPEKITVTPHGVDPAFAPGARAARRLRALRRRGPGAQGPARGARGGRAPSGCRSSSPGPRRSPSSRAELRARRRRRARLGRAGRARASSTAARPRSSCRRASRASACRCSRRWRAGRRSSSPTTRRCARSPATRRSTPRTATSARRSQRVLADRDRYVARGPRARALLHLGGDGAADGRRLPEGARVRVAAVVVSHGHPRELEESLPALRPQVDELVVIANVPGSVPRRRRRGAQRRAARLRREHQQGRRADDRRARRSRRTRTPFPSRGAVAALARVHGGASALRRRRAADASSRTARWQPSRRRFPTVTGTIVRRTPLRLRRRRSAATSTSTRRRPPSRSRPTGCSAASCCCAAAMLDGARRLRRGLPALRRGHRPRLPRDAGGLGALVRPAGGRRGTSTRRRPTSAG